MSRCTIPQMFAPGTSRAIRLASFQAREGRTFDINNMGKGAIRKSLLPPHTNQKRLEGAVLSHDRADGTQDQFEVKPERGSVDILHIKLHPVAI